MTDPTIITGPLIVSGLVLGVLQLLVGVGIGYWVASPRSALESAAEDSRRARRLAGELRTLTADLSRTARDQGDRLGRVDARLQSEARTRSAGGGDRLTSLVSGVVREMMLTNQQLVERLAAAEQELESRIAEAAEHLQTAMTDPLTGLCNRRALDDQLAVRMDAWRKHRTPFSVAMIDVDHFKRFNDSHGHSVGDEALKAVASALTAALRQHDVVARYGGEEFAIVLPHTTLQSARAAVDKAIDAVRHTRVEAKAGTLSLTASIGLASIGPAEGLESLMQRSDAALYHAKLCGRDQAWMHDGRGLIALGAADDGAGHHDDALAPDLEQACSALASSVSELLEAGPAPR